MGSNGVRNLDDNQGVDLPIDNDDDGVEYIVRIWTIITGKGWVGEDSDDGEVRPDYKEKRLNSI